MTKGNWIKVSRCVLTHDKLAYSKADPACRRSAFLDLVALATSKGATVQGIKLERGQYLTTVRALAAQWFWTHAKVRWFLADFTANHMLICSTLNSKAGTVVTICNYDKWQGELQELQQTEQQTTRSATAKREQEGLNKKSKKVKTPDPVSGQTALTLGDVSQDPGQGSPDLPTSPAQDIFDHWSRVAATKGLVKPRKSVPDAYTEKRILKALKHNTSEEFKQVIDHLGTQDWATGKRNGWKADLDWITREHKIEGLLAKCVGQGTPRAAAVSSPTPPADYDFDWRADLQRTRDRNNHRAQIGRSTKG
jgi:hypothetical protein